MKLELKKLNGQQVSITLRNPLIGLEIHLNGKLTNCGDIIDIATDDSCMKIEKKLITSIKESTVSIDKFTVRGTLYEGTKFIIRKES